jgi:serine/threonine-protein kinase RsbW
VQYLLETVEDMTAETVYRVLDSTLDTVTEVENLVWEVAQRAGFRDLSLDHIGLAAHETAVNAVIHDNRFSPARKIFVAISVHRDEIKITIGDAGEGFDARTLPDPFASQELLRGSGRGIYLARALMDEHHVHSRDGGGTQVTLIKYSQQQECTEEVGHRLKGQA